MFQANVLLNIFCYKSINYVDEDFNVKPKEVRAAHTLHKIAKFNASETAIHIAASKIDVRSAAKATLT